MGDDIQEFVISFEIIDESFFYDVIELALINTRQKIHRKLSK